MPKCVFNSKCCFWIITLTRKQRTRVEDFKYLCLLTANKVDIIWKSAMTKELKIQIFRITEESFLV